MEKYLDVSLFESRFRSTTRDDSFMGNMFSSLAYKVDGKLVAIGDNAELELAKFLLAYVAVGVADKIAIQLHQVFIANKVKVLDYLTQLDNIGLPISICGQWKSRPVVIEVKSLRLLVNIVEEVVLATTTPDAAVVTVTLHKVSLVPQIEK